MRLHILSDLHLEFAMFSANRPDADVIVLAGDISIGEDGLRWIEQNLQNVPVIYVLGNHEFYGHALPALTDNLKQHCAGTNVRLLERDTFEFRDVVFIGATLWTDFRLDGDPVRAGTVAAIDMADFRQIRFGRSHRRFRPSDAHALHGESLRWLDETL